MRFYKVKTPHNQEYIDEIIKGLKSAESDYIISLYGQISMVEYTNDEGNECMFAILDNYQISKLEYIYQMYNIKFKLVDLTKKIIHNDKVNVNYKNNWGRSVEEEIISLIEEFKNNWITKDDILDKIIEKGMKSLTKFDLKVLKS